MKETNHGLFVPTRRTGASTNAPVDPASPSSSPPTPAPSPIPSTFYSRIHYKDGILTPSKDLTAESDTEIAEVELSAEEEENYKATKRHNLQPSLLPAHVGASKMHHDTLSSAQQVFGALSNEDKQLFLNTLLGSCGREVLAGTQAFISPRLKRDPFMYLPRELSLLILSHIDDPKTLARASQVSRLWYFILSDDLTWKELCKSHHFRRLSAAVNIQIPQRPRLPSLAVDPASMRNDDLNEATYNPEATRKPVPTSYRSHFKTEYLLNSAWKTGGRLAARYVIANPGVVTALLMTNRYIVVSLDNNKIYVFREDGKLLRSLFGHIMGVWALAALGDTLVSGGCDRDVRMWDLKTGQCKAILKGHSSTIRCLEMVDENTAISGSRDTTLRVWDLEKGVCKRTLHGHTSSVRCMQVVGDICVTGSYDYTARVWKISTGECLHILQGHISQIYSLAFDGQKIATGSLDASIRIWDATTGACTALLQGHTSLVGQLQMEDNLVVSGGSDGTVRVWNLVTSRCIHRFAAHDNSVTSLQFDESRVVSGGSDGQVKVWDLNTGSLVRELASGYDSVWRVAFRDEKVAVLASKNSQIHMELTSFIPPKELIEPGESQTPPQTSGVHFRTQFNSSPVNHEQESVAPEDDVAMADTDQKDASPPLSIDPNKMDLS